MPKYVSLLSTFKWNFIPTWLTWAAIAFSFNLLKWKYCTNISFFCYSFIIVYYIHSILARECATAKKSSLCVNFISKYSYIIYKHNIYYANTRNGVIFFHQEKQSIPNVYKKKSLALYGAKYERTRIYMCALGTACRQYLTLISVEMSTHNVTLCSLFHSKNEIIFIKTKMSWSMMT